MIKTQFPQRCLVIMEYMVFSVKPHYSALAMSCRLPSPKESCPLTSSLQVMSSSERTVWASCAPYSWASQKAILSVYETYLKTIRITRRNRVNVSQDKEPNGIFYTWFDVLFRPLLCSAGGTSNTVRWL